MIITGAKEFLLNGNKNFIMRHYNIFTQVYTQSGQIEVVENCNGYTATNIGADIVTINGQVLFPGTVGSILGDSVSVGGNEGEIYKGRLDIAFAAITNPQLQIVQKYYIK